MKGNYQITLNSIDNSIFLKMDTLAVGEISVTNTEVFQYVDLKNSIILKADKMYLISYFNDNHNSVYDAGLGRSVNYSKSCKLPMQLNDLTINTLFYSYYILSYDNKKYLSAFGTFNEGIFRGLVDFKYEVVK